MVADKLWSRLCVAALALVAAGCSFQATLDGMVSRERQDEFIAAARALCGDRAGLQRQFDPALWQRSQGLFAAARSQCPPTGTTDWRLTTYRYHTATDIGGATTRQEYALIVGGDADGPWSEISLNYAQSGNAPVRIVGWNVARTPSRPPSLAFIDSYDRARRWGLGGVAFVFTLLAVTLVLFRQHRRKQGKRMTDA